MPQHLGADRKDTEESRMVLTALGRLTGVSGGHISECPRDDAHRVCGSCSFLCGSGVLASADLLSCPCRVRGLKSPRPAPLQPSGTSCPCRVRGLKWRQRWRLGQRAKSCPSHRTPKSTSPTHHLQDDRHQRHGIGRGVHRRDVVCPGDPDDYVIGLYIPLERSQLRPQTGKQTETTSGPDASHPGRSGVSGPSLGRMYCPHRKTKP